MQNNARAAALAAMERCRRDGAWSGASISSAVKSYRLDRRDSALSARLCLGVMQNTSLCDFYLDCFCDTPTAKLQPKLRDILRLGVYQLVMMDKIPASAAVNESVALARQSGFSNAAGLVNAVLRKVASNLQSLPEIPGKGSPAYLSVRYSHPLWLCRRVFEEKGGDFAEAFFASNNANPKLFIQVNTLKISTADYEKLLDAAGVPFEKCEQLDNCLMLQGGSVVDLPGFADGYFYVQDKAARLCSEIAGFRPGMAVLDCCAAPGGKSFSAAIAMNNSGEIVACDIHDKKLNLVCQGAERLGISIIDTAACDARKHDSAYVDRFDAVIADVPCSGMGVIGKKPEIRNKSELEIKELPTIQGDILNNVAEYVKPGGVLVYSTCTVFKEENEDVVEKFLSEHNDFVPEAFTLGRISAEGGMYTFWPNVDGTDGFFAAKLRRCIR